MSVRCSSKKDAIFFNMAFQSGCRLEDLAVPSPSQLGAAFFINNNTIRSLFCFFVYLVASINKFELFGPSSPNLQYFQIKWSSRYSICS